ncbi:PTS transporter subunit EIIC [Mycoplasma putrefaciens]|uniref:Phosphotransferase system PTS, IIBC component n=1 Tax=Mycoplasma putrefaciens Mput9231 TaxID=1292033 RepID=M9WGF9_9MOLU|nr:PTS transporter subunit EIIC [Mycoplasma putrefaciens]AGJ90520.1 Phosphotransferase system PTS, IIBC component [Mycoplasma putrefaciens Mput9231]
MNKQPTKSKFSKQKLKSRLSSFRASLESFGRAILVPVTVIPLLALIGAIGYTGQAILAQLYPQGSGTKPPEAATLIVNAIKDLGMIAITNIDFLVAVGLAAGLAKSEKVSAALSGLMAYAAIHLGTSLMLKIIYTPEQLKEITKAFGLSIRFGVLSFQYSAFGGMIAGLIGYLVHKYTYKLKFPEVLSFFGGPKFSPVAATLVGWVFGLGLGFVWIYISKGLYASGKGLQNLGAFSPFLYASAERALLPFGIHHVLNFFVYYTPVGASWKAPDGTTIEGVISVSLAKLAHNTPILAKETWVINGTYVTKIFSLTGATLAMFFLIPKKNRKVFGSSIISAGAVSALSGVTEPIEFTFLFVAPILYVVHVFLSGFQNMIMYLLNFGAVTTRGSGIITWLIVNPANWRLIQNVWGTWVVGPIMSGIYFVIFYFMIKKFNFKTPGCDETGLTHLITKKEYKKAQEDKSEEKELQHELEELTAKEAKTAKKEEFDDEFINNIIQGCGGAENIKIMANCVTRLRVTMHDKSKFNKEIVDKTNPYGYKEIGDQVQIIYGPKVTNIATLVREKLGVES